MNIKKYEINKIINCLTTFEKPLSKNILSICEKILMLDKVYNYNTKGDVIVVAGYPRCLVDRSPLARKLLINDIAKYAILSGGVNIPNTGISESKIMFSYLLSEGVNIDQLIIEDNSKTTIENAYYSSIIINKKFKYKEINLIALTSNFHLRRFTLALELHCNKNNNTNILPMPSISSDCPPNSWHKTILGRAIVAREIQILEKHTTSGRLPSFKL